MIPKTLLFLIFDLIFFILLLFLENISWLYFYIVKKTIITCQYGWLYMDPLWTPMPPKLIPCTFIIENHNFWSSSYLEIVEPGYGTIVYGLCYALVVTQLLWPMLCEFNITMYSYVCNYFYAHFSVIIFQLTKQASCTSSNSKLLILTTNLQVST